MLVAILVVLLICVILLAAFAIQNTTLVTVFFLGWVFSGVPIWVLVTIAAALGAIVAVLAFVPSRIKRGFQERSIHTVIAERDKKIGELSTSLSSLQAERDQIASELDQTKSERDELVDHLSLATSDRDRLLQEVKLLTAERDRLAGASTEFSTKPAEAPEYIPESEPLPPPTEKLDTWPGPEGPEEPRPPEKKSWWDPRP